MPDPWTVHAETVLYRSRWVTLGLADVQRPTGVRHTHHVVRLPAEGAGAVVVDRAGNVLLIHRHRFIPDCWGWELPAGRIDPGETPVEAAVREVREETGWVVRDPRPLCSLLTSPGMCDQRSHVILAEADHHDGSPADGDEAAEVRWWHRDQLDGLLRAGQVVDGFTLAGLLWYLHLACP